MIDDRNETISEKVSRWRKTVAGCREAVQEKGNISGAGLTALRVRGDAFEECANDLEQCNVSKLICPTTELKEKSSVILFFDDEQKLKDYIESLSTSKITFTAISGCGLGAK